MCLALEVRTSRQSLKEEKIKDTKIGCRFLPTWCQKGKGEGRGVKESKKSSEKDEQAVQEERLHIKPRRATEIGS